MEIFPPCFLCYFGIHERLWGKSVAVLGKGAQLEMYEDIRAKTKGKKKGKGKARTVLDDYFGGTLPV